jgi:DNA-binding CsgD family transcriptional regulator
VQSGVDRTFRAALRACYAASDDLPSLRKRLLGRLKRLVPIEAAFFAAADPDTLLFTSASADPPLASVGPLFLANEFGPVDDVNRFRELARARRPVATLDEATGGRRASSPRFREIMDPLGLGDELRVALRTGSTTWGFLCLHREGATGFSASEVALVQRVAPHGGEAMRRIVAESIAHAPEAGGQAGVVLVEDDQVVALTDAAGGWLEELDELRVIVGGPVPVPLLAVIRRLEAVEAGLASDAPAAMRLSTRRGLLLEVHAARLRRAADRGPIAITLAPADAVARSGLRLAAHDLTPAQRRVAALVLQGRSTRQMVAELRIGEHTVQDHLKTVFDKLGVGSRRELVAALLR